MGILEIIGELINPGPVGEVDFNDKKYEVQQNLIPVRFVISVIIIGIVEYLFVFQKEYMHDYSQLLKINAFLIIYLFIASVTRIKPDYNNLGWVPFLINNPFRISDSINRFLVILNILLMPGKFITKSVIGFYMYCRKQK